MVPSTPVEIAPPDTPVASTNPVPAIDAPNSVQQDIPYLPTSASWDDFLLEIARFFMESRIEDVGDILDDICLLFVEETTSCIVEIDSDTSNSTSIDSDTWVSIDSCSKRS